MNKVNELEQDNYYLVVYRQAELIIFIPECPLKRGVGGYHGFLLNAKVISYTYTEERFRSLKIGSKIELMSKWEGRETYHLTEDDLNIYNILS